MKLNKPLKVAAGIVASAFAALLFILSINKRSSAPKRALAIIKDKCASNQNKDDDCELIDIANLNNDIPREYVLVNINEHKKED